MPRNWDQTLKDWAETIYATDEARGKSAREGVKNAVHDAGVLAQKRIDVFVTGSYRNNTNIRAERIVNSLPIQASRERIHDAAVKQAMPLVRRVVGYDQVKFRFEQRIQQLVNPLPCDAFHL